MCVEPVVAGTQSCQNHLAWPVKKMVCILLLSRFQRCFDDGGLFLVMDAGWWFLFLCSAFAYLICLLVARDYTVCWHPLHVLPSSCICVARRGDFFVWKASNTDNASVRKTVGEHGSKESLTKVAACLSASVSALLLVQCFPVAVLRHWDTGWWYQRRRLYLLWLLNHLYRRVAMSLVDSFQQCWLVQGYVW